MAATQSSGSVDSAHPAVANPWYSQPAGWNWTYILGYANSGFTDVTRFHVDDVRFYDRSPGW
jgi:hypothetical protein